MARDGFRLDPAEILWEHPDAALVVGDDETVHYANAALGNLLGHKPEEVRQKPVRRLLWQGDVATYRALAASTGNTFGQDLRLLHRDGSQRYCDVVAARLGASAWLLSLHDVTRWRQRQHDTQIILHSTRRLRGVGVWKYWPKERRFHGTPEVSHIFGLPVGETVTTDHFLSLLHPDDRENLLQDWDHVPKLVGRAPLEFRIVRTGGEVRHLRALVTMSMDLATNDLLYLGTLQDVTERHHMEAQVTRAAKWESLELLAGGVAHDFNNLLAVMVGNIALAEQLVPEGLDALAGSLEAAERAGWQAQNLTKQLLLFAKFGSPSPSPVHVDQLLRDSVQFALTGAKARAEYLATSPLPEVPIDPAHLHQIVQNLLWNAGDAMEEGGIILIRAGRAASSTLDAAGLDAAETYLEIQIQDQGPGIPTALQEKIFDPYFTTKRHGQGLGLAICDAMVRRYHGRIVLRSELGRGSTFTILLPAAASRTPSTVPIQEAFTPELEGARLLVMDDEPALREMVRRMLERQGAHVVGVADGEAAIMAYQQAFDEHHPFDVVLLDWLIPGGKSGEAALAALREMHPQVPVVVTSGYAPGLPTDVPFLPKPFRTQDLYRAIEGVRHRTGSP